MDRTLYITRGLALKAFQELVLVVGPAVLRGAHWIDAHQVRFRVPFR